jgi:hypothetical protein
LLGFIIGIPKYPQGLGGPGGSKLPPLGSNGYLTKILSISLGISICTLTSYVSLRVWGFDLILTTIWFGAITNGASITITID